MYIFLNSISAIHTSFGFETSMPVAASSPFSSIVSAVVTPLVPAHFGSEHQLEHPTGK